ncbi:MAG TPA: HAMP domain-containing sensor histidine kinase [Solirubrobacterales bacterium]|nr:HAMP domain-containing sensor histidine kinase [Solirubrobacterales bacterium]
MSAHLLAAAVFLAVCGVPVLVLTHLLARHRRRLGSLSNQFAAGVALILGLALAGVAAVALLMFVSAHDAYLLATLLAFACALAVYSSWLLSRGIRADIETVRDALRAVGEGAPPRAAIETGGRDEIAELARAADSMAARLAEQEAGRAASERARRDLIAAISHDLRTPLTSLQLLAQGIDDGVLDSGVGENGYADQISLHVGALTAMVDDLFELTRLEAGEIQWSMERVRLDELVGETIESMRSQAAAKGIAVRAHVPGGLAAAEANPEKLQRVLFNLIQNAIRHTPADGSVVVAAERAGEAIEIEVADTGSGIPARDRDRVFEPFFRGDASRGSGGSGLGLSICRAIIEVHGGRIWLDEGATGTRVRFTLPRARIDAGRAEGPRPARALL